MFLFRPWMQVILSRHAVVHTTLTPFKTSILKVVCRVLCDELVSATSSEGVLVIERYIFDRRSDKR